MVKQELLKVADVRAELALVAAEYVRRYHAKVDTMTNNTTIELYSEYSEMEKRIIEDPIIFRLVR